MNNISKYRKEKKLSINDLAKKISVSSSVLESWELGLNIPTLDQLILLVKIFDTEADDLLFNEKKERLSLKNLDITQRKIVHNLNNYFIHENEVKKNDFRKD